MKMRRVFLCGKEKIRGGFPGRFQEFPTCTIVQFFSSACSSFRPAIGVAAGGSGQANEAPAGLSEAFSRSHRHKKSSPEAAFFMFPPVTGRDNPGRFGRVKADDDDRCVMAGAASLSSWRA